MNLLDDLDKQAIGFGPGHQGQHNQELQEFWDLFMIFIRFEIYYIFFCVLWGSMFQVEDVEVMEGNLY